MSDFRETYISPMEIKRAGSCINEDCQSTKHPKSIPAPEQPLEKRVFHQATVAAALLLCASALRAGAIPDASNVTDVVLTAITDQSLLDDNLGKLSFVSTLFPEAVLVFGEQKPSHFLLPVNSNDVIHAWTENEPYTSWSSIDRDVVAPEDGEVLGVYHGNNNEKLVEIRGVSGYSWLYGNLEEVYVTIGESVSHGTIIGHVLNDADIVFEVRQNGRSLDPQIWLGK